MLGNLHFGQSSVTGGFGGGALTGTQTDDGANNGYEYTVEVDTDGDGAADTSVGVYSPTSAFTIPLTNLPIGDTEIALRAWEIDGATGEEVSSAWQTFTVTIVNTEPVFWNIADDEPQGPDGYAFTVAENWTGMLPTSITARDPDAGDSVMLYELTEDAPAGITIDSSTGALTITTGFDYEELTQNGGEPEFTFTVAATDTNGATSDCEVTLVVTNVNEAPVFSAETYSVSVAEDFASGSWSPTALPVSPTVQANDPDDFNLTYSITGGNSHGLFVIDPDSGVLSLAEGASFDFETTPSYSLAISVADPAGLTDTATVTIDVSNVNESPEFEEQIYRTFVRDNVITTTSVPLTFTTAIEAFDPDGDAVTYTIASGNEAGNFVIDAVTGVVSVAAGALLDASLNDQYTLTIAATDAGGLSDTATVEISIHDADAAFSIFAEPTPDEAAVGESTTLRITITLTPAATALGQPVRLTIDWGDGTTSTVDVTNIPYGSSVDEVVIVDQTHTFQQLPADSSTRCSSDKSPSAPESATTSTSTRLLAARGSSRIGSSQNCNSERNSSRPSRPLPRSGSRPPLSAEPRWGITRSPKSS